MNLKEILEKAGSDDSHFRALYDLTIDQVFAFALSRIRNRDSAKEICQEAYLSLWQSMPNFQYISDAHFYAFLFKVLRRKISKAKMKIRNTVSIEEIYDIPAEEETKEDFRALLSGLENLKENQRVVIELRYFKDLDFQSIAGILNISESNAKVLHHRGLKRLKELLPFYE